MPTWEDIKDIRLPRAICWMGTPTRKTDTPAYSLEEIIVSDGLYWFANWAETITFIGLESVIYQNDPSMEVFPGSPKNIDEVKVALDTVFLGRKQAFCEEVIEACSRCSQWNTGGITGTWDEWASEECKRLGIDRNSHSCARMYEEMSPIIHIWSEFFNDACISSGATIRWDDTHRMNILRDIGETLGIGSAIDAYLAGSSLDFIVEGKRTYDYDGTIEEL